MRGESCGEKPIPRRGGGRRIWIVRSRKNAQLDTCALQRIEQHGKLQFLRIFDGDAAYDRIAGDLPHTTGRTKLLLQGLHSRSVTSQDYCLHAQPAFHMMQIGIRRGPAVVISTMTGLGQNLPKYRV